MNCYIVDPTENYELPKGMTKDNTLFWPESGMTTRQKTETSRPRDFHIITDCPDLVGLYKREEVFIWKGGKWVHPKINTYGTSINLIRHEVFGIKSTIPRAVLDGKVTNCMGQPLKYES